jgi:hypothetical protein
MQHKILNHIILNENAYFYKKDDVKNYFTTAHINEMFIKASENKKGNYLLNLRKQVKVVDGQEIQFSICVFKLETVPNFIDKVISENWHEQKIAYLLISDFKDYVFITRKNISGIDHLLYSGLSLIDYSILNSLFVDSETYFEKFSLNNTSISPDSIRGKTVEAIDLKKSFSPYGAGKYVLSSVRVNNFEEKTSIVFNTSRITMFGKKKYLNELFKWAFQVIEKIRSHNQENSFLDIFATPIEYDLHRESLVPISILFNLRKFNEDLESGRIQNCEFRLSANSIRQLPLNKISNSLQKVFDVKKNGSEPNFIYKIITKLSKDIELTLNKKSITINSKKGSKLFLNLENGSTLSLINYFNSYNDFIINFEDLSLVYSNRKLFKDSKLISYIDNFINVFNGKIELKSVTSEKGRFTDNSTSFNVNSIFGFVENKITYDSNFCFLDDLGNEWADFIKINSKSLTFIHAKFDKSQFSASSFHEVVGQALKNIGNMTPTNEQLEIKADHWINTFNIHGEKTKITRLRNGSTLEDGIKAYKKLLLSPNLMREIIIVVNFISISQLRNRLNLLKKGEQFKEKNQVIQILWLLSSLINSCQENGIRVNIICKP